MFHKKDKNLWAFILPMSFFVSGCWFEKKNAGEDDLTVIKEFSVEPKSVAEGESVAFKILGENIKSCTLFANDNEISALSLTDDEVTSHVPSSINTAYKAICDGESGKAETESITVNIILADDVIESDALADIATKFDIDAIKSSIKEEYPDYKVVDFSSEYNDELPKPDNEVIRVDSSSSALDIENSIIYGFEGNLNSKHDQVCRDTLNLESSINSAEFNTFLDTSIDEKEMILEDQIHIDGFEALTHEILNPIPKGTEWDISYRLSKTELVYQDNFVEFGEASGSFKIGENGELVVEKTNTDLNSLTHTEKFARRNFPPHYPIPPSKNGYEFDPNTEVCNGNTLAPKPFVYSTAHLFCKKSHLRKRYLSFCRWDESGRNPHTRPVNSPTFPYTDYVKVLWPPIKNFGVRPVPSKRVITHPAQLDCKGMFPDVASQAGISRNWTTNYQAAQWFIHDRNWPLCNGANCAQKSLRNGPNDIRFNRIERYSNQCIDRWMGKPWSTYQNSILAQCKREKVYTDAIKEREGEEKKGRMIASCSQDNSCKELVKSMKKSIEDYLYSSEILSYTQRMKADYDNAKNESKSFLIPIEDKYFSKINKIKRIYNGFNDSALQKLTNLYSEIGGANWVSALNELLESSVPREYHSPSALNKAKNNFKDAIKIMDEISKVEILESACQWEAKGRFKVFKDNRLLEVRKIEVDSSETRLKLKSIYPIILE